MQSSQKSWPSSSTKPRSWSEHPPGQTPHFGFAHLNASGANVLPRARINGPLICSPVMAQTGILPEKTGCWTLALPAPPSVGFLGPLGIDGIFGGAAASGATTSAGAGARASEASLANSSVEHN